MSDNVQLTRNQSRALAALMASRSVRDAAASCKLSEKTLRRYLDDPIFQDALHQAEAEVLDGVGRILLAGSTSALGSLNRVMHDGKDTDRRQASVSWLDLLLKWRQAQDLEARVAALEAQNHGT